MVRPLRISSRKRQVDRRSIRARSILHVEEVESRNVPSLLGLNALGLSVGLDLPTASIALVSPVASLSVSTNSIFDGAAAPSTNLPIGATVGPATTTASIGPVSSSLGGFFVDFTGGNQPTFPPSGGASLAPTSFGPSNAGVITGAPRAAGAAEGQQNPPAEADRAAELAAFEHPAESRPAGQDRNIEPSFLADQHARTLQLESSQTAAAGAIAQEKPGLGSDAAEAADSSDNLDDLAIDSPGPAIRWVSRLGDAPPAVALAPVAPLAKSAADASNDESLAAVALPPKTADGPADLEEIGPNQSWVIALTAAAAAASGYWAARERIPGLQISNLSDGQSG